MDMPDHRPVMPSNRVRPQWSTYSNLGMDMLPDNNWSMHPDLGMDMLDHDTPMSWYPTLLATNDFFQAAAMPPALHRIWNSDTHSLDQAAPTPAAMPYSIWNSETANCLCQAAPMLQAMSCSTSNSELAVQRIPLSELQNSGAMKLLRSKLKHYAQMRSASLNPQNRVNFGTIPASIGTNADDDFMMYHFKVERCPNNKNHHDWTDCQFLHDNEKARRRDPRKYLYSGKPCADFRKRGQCENGDQCHFAHGVFETWLHPDKYKTQMCRDRDKCQRKVCFFAHWDHELREGDGVTEDISFDLSPKSVISMKRISPESLDKSINNDITKGMETLTSKTSHNGIKNIENGGAHTVVDSPKLNI